MSSSASSPAAAGTLTAPRSRRPPSAATTWSATDSAARRRASAVTASAGAVSSRCGAASTAGRERLAGLDGHGGAGHAAVAQRLRQRLEVHSARRTRADEPGAGLELRQLCGAEQRARLRRRLHHQHVGARQDQLRRDALERADDAARGVLVAREHLHAERARPLREQARARAHAHQPERLAADLGAVARPPAGVAAPQRGVRAGQVAGDRQHERQRVLGLRDERAVGRVHHEDAAPRGLGDVDRPGVLAGAADDAEGAPLGEHARRDRSARLEHECVVAAHGRRIGQVRLGAHVDPQALVLEARDALGREAAQHQHVASRGHVSLPGFVACVVGALPNDRLVHHGAGSPPSPSRRRRNDDGRGPP